MQISSEFWNGFWSNLLSNVALIGFVSLGGYLAKAKILKSFKKFLHKQVMEIIEQVVEEETKKRPL